ncbi:MAG TPA: LysR family transcriptional regulator [Woeseiaceae bacterium]|nr:LysR family transcriptional regulator [Woeseiaceae bacterium]
MKLQQLKYLLAIVDNGLNITAAADRLYTSQPGVSKQLKLLEDELGLQLFTRKGKSLDGITAAGDVVIGRARLIMHEVDGIRSLSHRHRADHSRFGTVPNHAVHATMAASAAGPRRNLEQL